MRRTRLANLLPLTLLAVVFWSCQEDSIEKIKGDYFPLENNHEWTYQRCWRFWKPTGGVDSTSLILDTLKLRVSGDTLVEGQLYKKITNADGSIEKIIRIEDFKYYGRSHELYSGFSHEYMFLDTSKPVGSSWEYLKNGGLTKTQYVIISRNGSVNILGNRYQDVIEVKVNYYRLEESSGAYIYMDSAMHYYYAKGVGEIYNLYPPSVALTYLDINSFLIGL